MKNIIYLLLISCGIASAMDDFELRRMVLEGSGPNPADTDVFYKARTQNFPDGHCRVQTSHYHQTTSMQVTYHPNSDPNSAPIGRTSGRLYGGIGEYGDIQVDEQFRRGGIATQLNDPLFRELMSKADSVETHWAGTNEAKFLERLDPNDTPSVALYKKHGWMVKKVHYKPGLMPAVEYMRDYPRGILDGAKLPDRGMSLCSNPLAVKNNPLGGECGCPSPKNWRVGPAGTAAGFVAPIVANEAGKYVAKKTGFDAQDQGTIGALSAGGSTVLLGLGAAVAVPVAGMTKIAYDLEKDREHRRAIIEGFEQYGEILGKVNRIDNRPYKWYEYPGKWCRSTKDTFNEWGDEAWEWATGRKIYR